MLDLHCHLLPSVDDGAVDLEEALAMVRALMAAGFSGAAPSPHSGCGPGGDVSRAKADYAREVLKQGLEAQGLRFDLWTNAEHYFGPELFGRESGGQLTTLGGTTRWLLVEIPWQGLPNLEDAIFRVQARGFKLLLAHPERSEGLDDETLEKLVLRGVRMQVELGSPIGLYGRDAERRAGKWLRAGLVHIVATDLHHGPPDSDWLAAALVELRRVIGEAGCRRVLSANPRAILGDAPADLVTG